MASSAAHPSSSVVTYVGDGASRRCRRVWRADGNIRAQLFLCHGTHEHSASLAYERLAVSCTSEGIEVLALDFQGHGRSGGMRGDIGSLEQTIADVVGAIREQRRPVPLIVVGHSLGSMIAFLAAHKLAVEPELPTPSMVVLSGFAMDSVSPPFGFKSLIPVLRAAPSAIRVICAQLARLQPTGPACPLPPASELTSFPDVARATMADPHHYHGWIQNRTALALLDARSGCEARLSTFGASPGAAFPFLLVHGGADELCPRSACDALMAASPQADKELIVFPGLLHEVLGSEVVRRSVIEWCLKRIAPRSRL